MNMKKTLFLTLGLCMGLTLGAAEGNLLKNGGDFFVIYRPDRLCDLFVAMRNAGLEPKEMTEVTSKVGEPPSLVLVRGKKGAASDLKISKEILV
jgi:tRNA1(Val) A37 N6-methylase TrmN6